MKRVLVAASSALLSACSLLLADDLKQNRATERATPAEAGALDGTASAIDEGGTAADAEAGSALVRRPFGPLAASAGGDILTARVAGFFELAFRGSNGWKPTELRDLALADSLLAGKFFEPLSTTVEGMQVATATDTGAGYYEYFDETPVRVGFTTYAHHVLPSGADAKVWNEWVIYATGRVVVRTEVNNAGTAALALPADWIHQSIAMDTRRGWNVVDDATGRTTMFEHRETGLGVFAFYYPDPARRASRAVDERHWRGNAQSLATGGKVEIVTELQLGAAPSEVSLRTADLGRSRVGAISGMELVGSGFAFDAGAYTLEAQLGATRMTFELDPGEARVTPAFDIYEFTASGGWSIENDGRVVASSDAPTTAFGTSRVLPDKKRLVFAYFGTIPRDASLAARTFTITRR